MIFVEEWISVERKERTDHTDLTEPCLERGGNSTVHRGVLAQFLGTDLPKTNKINLCHLCGNEKCSNPKHLYWGTVKENIEDSKDHGTWKSPWDSLVERYGLEEACEMQRRKALVGGARKAGSGNKGKQKTEQHCERISEGVKLYWRNWKARRP